MKADTTQKMALVQDRLANMTPALLDLVYGVLSGIQQNDFATAQGLLREVSQKHWNEARDWCNGLKPLIQFKQKYAHH